MLDRRERHMQVYAAWMVVMDGPRTWARRCADWGGEAMYEGIIVMLVYGLLGI